MSIVAGVIIDKFSDLRIDQKITMYDMNNICFICNENRDVIEKITGQKMGFEMHLLLDHNFWNYLFFIAYIQNKKQTEHTGTESYVWE